VDERPSCPDSSPDSLELPLMATLTDMKRRHFLQCGLAAALSKPLWAALHQEQLDQAADVLTRAVDEGQVDAAVLHARQRETASTRHFGKTDSGDAMFLLGSISKPICVTALMTLFDRGEFRLDDPLTKFIPHFTGEGRDRVTLQQLLTHVSGLPDQLPENDTLRKNHAELAEFVDRAIRTPLQFVPGERYQYSSMGILLATRVAEVISGFGILEFVDRTVFEPLQMTRSAQGLGRFQREDMVPCQTEHAAPEAGAGDPAARDWDWNSPYWRKLGAPWGGTHASAPDLGRFLDEFLNERGAVVKPETARLMVHNQNDKDLTPRGLGFNVGPASGSPGCSESTFGHTGSTGTIAWADPSTKTICVVLTSLPGKAIQPHPREMAAAWVAAAVD
jgi:CubicO group peptidase (beta-lactamase class C family)